MNRYKMAVVGAGVLAMVVIGVLANAQGNSSRSFALVSQAGAPFDIASGNVFISPLQSAPEPLAKRFMEYSVHNLAKQGPGSQSYGIYLSTPSLGRVRLRTFNTTGGEHPHNVWSEFHGVPDDENPLWVTETITVEIYVEADDGFDAPDVGGLLVLKGVDQP